MKTRRSVLGMAFCILSFASAAQAVFVQTDFNGASAGSINGQPGVDVGFSVAWSSSTSVIIAVKTNDLVAPAGTGFALSQAGDGTVVANITEHIRQQQRKLSSALDGVVWGSFLVQPTSATSVAGIGFNVANYNPGEGRIVARGTDLFVRCKSGTPDFDYSDVFEINETALIIFKISLDASGDNDYLTLWVNPDLTDLASQTPLIGNVSMGNVYGTSLTYLNVISYSNDKSLNNGGLLDMITLSNGPDGFSDVTSGTSTLVIADFNDLNLTDQWTQSGGTGFTGAWSGTGTLGVYEGDLTAPPSTGYALTQSGNPQSIMGTWTAARQNTRLLDVPLTGNTVWFSFLVQNVTDSSYGGISWNGGSYTPVNPRVQTVGKGLFLNSTTIEDVFTAGQTALVLGRITADESGHDTVDIWVDPALRGGETRLGTPTASTTDVYFDAGRRIAKIGTISYGDSLDSSGAIIDMVYLSDQADGFFRVTGVPEPPAGTVITIQ